MSIINTIISFIVITGLVWVSQSFRSIKFILEKGGSFLDFLKLSLFSMPSWLYISVSFGVFFGVFLTFVKLENDKEMIAMKSSGLNSLQLSYPIIILSLIFSSFLFLNFHFFLPKSYSFYKNYEDSLRYKKPQILFNEGTFFHFDNKTIFAKSIKGNEIQKIFIKDYSFKDQTIDIFAKKAFLNHQNNTIKIKLINGIKIISKKNSNPLTINFSEDIISFNKKKSQKNPKAARVVDLKEFTFSELLIKSKNEPKSRGIYLSEAHSRNIFSLTPLIFSVIFLSIFLRSQHSRYDNFLRKFLIISIIFSIQIFLFSLKNVLTKYTDYMLVFYLIPTLLLLTGLLFISYERFNFSILKKS